MGQSQSTPTDPAAMAFSVNGIPRGSATKSQSLAKPKLQRNDSAGSATHTVATCNSAEDNIPSGSASSGRRGRRRPSKNPTKSNSGRKLSSSLHSAHNEDSTALEDSMLQASWGDMDESVSVLCRTYTEISAGNANNSWSDMDVSLLQMDTRRESTSISGPEGPLDTHCEEEEEERSL